MTPAIGISGRESEKQTVSTAAWVRERERRHFGYISSAAHRVQSRDYIRSLPFIRWLYLFLIYLQRLHLSIIIVTAYCYYIV